ncbi:hypothetical protein XENTR_v10015236 [Xenopus tropicalis]|nr:hypothetical protein XENTR_v10015236 [Xenopus tropicalis]
MEVLFPARLKVLLLVLMFQVLPSAAEMPSPSSGCRLNRSSRMNYFSDGDLIIGGILQIHDMFCNNCFESIDDPACVSHYRHLLVLIYTIEEINKDPEILPNVTLGYRIYDSCASGIKSFASAFGILSGTEQPIPNYSCWNNRKISYGSRDPVFNDRVQFPSFYRTIPDELSEINGIVELIKHFGWKWVGLIVSDDEIGLRAGKNLEGEMKKHGICLAFNIRIDNGAMTSTTSIKIREKLLSSTANVIVLLVSLMYVEFFMFFFAVFDMPEKIWIVSSTFLKVLDTAYPQNRIIFNGLLALSVQQGEIPGFREYLYGLNPSLYKYNALFPNVSQRLSDCELFKTSQTIPSRTGISLPKCTESESFDEYGLSLNDTMNYRISYGVYTAVYTMALALHKLYMEQTLTSHPERNARLQKNFMQWKVRFYFKKARDPSTQYDILKCFFLEEGGARTVKVGSFDLSKPAGNRLSINTSADLWGPYFAECPISQCNEPCVPGYRKSKIEGKPLCCYKCVSCAEGEISNTTDAQSCIKCSKYEKPNNEKTECIPRNINFLSYEDTLGATLSFITLILFGICPVILGIFIKYRKTPIVRANNQYLSCLLLISLMLCFLCTLLFIGRPTQICCLLRQVTFGIVFTISVSSVLAKTLTVIIAFNATKPGSKLKKYVGTQLAIILVIVCSLVEVVISAVWLASNPPFPEADTLSDPDYIILLCNEGSELFFFCIIGYIGTLALLSFIAAFLAKDFPDRFNEAKNITFSMLGFCSVWGAFVPAYLSSKGSRMVAVEIFAILSSSAGLLGCIFIPKCYIIFLRPELNTKDTVVRKL